MKGTGPSWDLLQANDPHGLTSQITPGKAYTPAQSTSKEEVARRGGE